MKRINFALVLAFCFLFLDPGYALDWHTLHEEADHSALADTLAALSRNPDSPGRLYVLGLVYLDLHKDNEARDAFDKILSLAPGTFEAEWGAAEVLRRRHELDKSEAILNGILRAHPDFSPARISLAYIQYIRMNFNESVEQASYVIRQGRDSAGLSNFVRAITMYAGAKGMIAHYGGPVSKAINGTAVLSSLRKAEKLQPDSAAVLFGLGSFYLLAPSLVGGDLDKAIEYLEKAVKADPGFPSIYVRLAQAYLVKGDKAKYEMYLDKALALDPGNEFALDIKSGRCKFICAGKDQ